VLAPQSDLRRATSDDLRFRKARAILFADALGGLHCTARCKAQIAKTLIQYIAKQKHSLHICSFNVHNNDLVFSEVESSVASVDNLDD
jgi:hypothetical protein